LAVLLGLFVNHEKLKKHQIVGVALATVGVIILSYFS
jgi:EamA domain-containing membrane protein RarD